MPWGWECRHKFVKQNIFTPEVRKGLISQEVPMPGPDQYETPGLIGGPGYSHIKRMPAYSFGIKTSIKPARLPAGHMFDVSGMGRKGRFRIPGSLVSPQIEIPSCNTKTPGPSTYQPCGDSQYKSTPAYSFMPKARPPYEAWDQWTPPPNLYLPPIPEKRQPAYTFGHRCAQSSRGQEDMPGPGTYEPNFKYVQERKPSFSFGAPRAIPLPPMIPPPNKYCEKKFNANRPTIRASSFGIRHSPFLGKQEVFLKSSQQDIQISGT